MATYTPYGYADSSLIAVFDRTANNVPSPSDPNSGYNSSLPEALRGYIRESNSSSSAMNVSMQQTTAKINHFLNLGLPRWNATVPYEMGSFVQAQDPEGVVQGYMSIANDNLNYDPKDTYGKWLKFTNNLGDYLKRDMTNATLQTDYYITNKLFPVGSYWMSSQYPLQDPTSLAPLPPLQGVTVGSVTVAWQLIAEEYTIVASTPSNSGVYSGSNNLRGGNTGGTGLTEAQNGEHTHFGLIGGVEGPGGNAGLAVKNDGASLAQIITSSGEGEPHDHPLDVKTLTACIWLRIS